MRNVTGSRKLPLLTLLLFFTAILTAQNYTNTVRGRVMSSTNEPLVGANIVLDKNNFSTQTNTEGVFSLEAVPVGVYAMTVTFTGYKPLTIQNIRVETGKQTVIDIPLSVDDINLDAITIKGNRSFNTNQLTVTNQLPNSLLRFPATFNDPARAIAYLPGAAVDNDQGNNISVRGNSPNALQWYLEGAEIVNPNHLSNAGTPSDRSTANGGGVLILGTNLMESATFFKGAMSADLGGALTSVMDLRLRKGNDRKHQTTLSVGLIGLEVGSEGYFSDGKGKAVGEGRQRASYLIHYRYSTIGLLSKMGVPLGDEAITFQDLSYNLNFPTKKIGTFNVFGMHGLSDNVFKHKEFTEWETEKDSQDISYKNIMHAMGLKHQIGIGNRTKWMTVMAYSQYDLDYRKKAYNRKNELAFAEINLTSDLSKLFLKSQVQTIFNAGTLNVGIATKQESFLDNPKYEDTWVLPFAEWEGNINNFKYRIGARESRWIKSKSRNFEPSAGIQYALPNAGKIALNYSRQSQSFKNFDMPYELTKSENINLNYTATLAKSITFDIGGFYQNIKTFGSFDFTQMEELEKPLFGTSNTTLNGRNMGVELDINRSSIQNGYHWRFNTTLYDSKIIDDNGNERNSRFNGRYIVNGLIGKEWQYGKNQNKFWGINIHQILRGGFWETPLNDNGTQTGAPFSKQLKDYMRTDLSIYLKKSRLKWASTLQLDIQNLTNRQNEAWHYFDNFKRNVQTKYQLGMIPNLSYKVEF